MYRVRRIEDPADLLDLKTGHLKALTAPLDAYWEEALIGFSDHYEISVDGVRAGYYCLNDEGQMVAFYLSPEFADHGKDALGWVIERHKVPAAFAGSNDPYFHSLCVDMAKNVKVHTLLFEDVVDSQGSVKQQDGLSFEAAGEEDFQSVLEHYVSASGSFDTESVDAGFEGLKGYVRSVMNDHRIFLLKDGSELLATSECRISKTQKPYADVGMIVAEDHRRKGLGSYILAKTREFCRDRDVMPICSCEEGNIGSRKAILNAGFVSTNHIDLIDLVY
jgi:GNAT superfamily N-acetyltransferase